jgi:phage tail tape-measure protein
VLGQKAGRAVGEWLGRKLDRENQTDDPAVTADSESDDSEASSSHPARDELEEMSYRDRDVHSFLTNSAVNKEQSYEGPLAYWQLQPVGLCEPDL